MALLHVRLASNPCIVRLCTPFVFYRITAIPFPPLPPFTLSVSESDSSAHSPTPPLPIPMPRPRYQSFWHRASSPPPSKQHNSNQSSPTPSHNPSSQSSYVPDSRDDTDPLAPPPDLREHSFHRTGETFDLRQHSLAALRQLVSAFEHEQTHAPQDVRVSIPRSDDQFLLIFLRCKKFRVDPAYTEFSNFCRAHTNHPWLRTIDPILVERLFHDTAFQILPKGDRKGRLILTMDFKVLSPIVDDLRRDGAQHLLVAIFGMLETIMQDVRAQIFGVVVVSDLTGCKMRTFGFLSVQQYLLSLELCQHCYPIRASGMYMIHEPWFVRGLFSAMRPFMKPIVKENLRCFGTEVMGIHEIIPRESLLPTYGGNLVMDETANSKTWVDAVRSTFS